MVAAETPDLAGRTCHRRHGGEEQEDEKDGSQYVCRCERASSIVDHDDNGIVR